MFLRTVVVELLFLGHWRHAEATHAALDEEKIKTLCKIANQLTLTPAIVVSKANQIKKTQEAAQEASQLAQAAAAATSDVNTSTVFQATALQAANCAETAATQYTKLINDAQEVMLNGPKTAGHITEIAHLLLKLSGDNSKWCLGTSSTKTTHTTVAQLGCPGIYVDTPPAATATDPTLVTQTGFFGLAGAANVESSTGYTKCYLLKSGASTIWGKAGPINVKLAADFLGLTAQDSHGSETANLETLNAGATNGKFNPASTGPQKLFNAIHRLNNFELQNCGKTTEEALQLAAADPTTQTLLAQALAARNSYEQANQATSDAQHMLKAAADGKADEIGKKVMENIKQTSTARIENTKQTSKQLKETPTAEQRRQSILLEHMNQRYQILQLSTDLEGEKIKRNAATSKAKLSDDDCKAKTGGACKDGCKEISENGQKKCVVDKKEATKVEGGEKDNKTGTTNITGSNSFVINKAPLWLAVLLLE
ncbi:variant surface glycoprotein (VSG), putative [Trypanosoma brucei brucei TREU927]|uniref:Variant surface glycoprotein (VSG), putative n=1 Tax=Trypanosoma brucei brucei (strain 927/4 GUTat10.1) TaxID=185431 RepID=Q580P1_TRYB2|nr:variant surface glycoprotein (VSG), putative [Trypanosoma brucei brucei TREU927]AAX79143.1 variant surface glycoprotein (VSG), putative [Trypanosoma brucei]AAZ11133.1 variant surface glycoprotein (VSG), putative [Trypanosoma brucei brucei TREU927]